MKGQQKLWDKTSTSWWWLPNDRSSSSKKIYREALKWYLDWKSFTIVDEDKKVTHIIHSYLTAGLTRNNGQALKITHQSEIEKPVLCYEKD